MSSVFVEDSGFFSFSLSVSEAVSAGVPTTLNEELRGKLEEALQGLSENHRAILLLRELEGMSYEELAKVLGIRKGTVMSRLFHARLKMQNKLREYLGEDVPEGGGDEEV